MASPERSGRSLQRPLDATALARALGRMQSSDSPPWLHEEVARRMAERLPVIKLQPRCVLDWGAFLGASQQVLARAYPRAHHVAVETDGVRRDATAALLAQPWWSPQRWVGAGARVLTDPEVGPGQAELVWSNMGLHGVADPQALMRRWHEVLAVDGFLMFSTLGPGSLTSLQALYRDQGWGPSLAPFVDMHDLGDMLVEAGFADPVMDQETLTLTWGSAEALLAELRGMGGNMASERCAGLRTPRWRRRLLQVLESTADAEGRVALQFELVYGHAFRPLPRARVTARTEVALDDLRTMARAGRRPEPRG